MNLAVSTAPLPWIRSLALGVHGFFTAWLLVNGVGHQVGVLWKAHAGTLRPDADVSALLAVGAGLIVAGGALSFSLGPLSRPIAPSSLPAFAGLGVLAAVLAATAIRYGFTFLRGSIALGVIDLGVLAAFAAAGARP